MANKEVFRGKISSINREVYRCMYLLVCIGPDFQYFFIHVQYLTSTTGVSLFFIEIIIELNN